MTFVKSGSFTITTGGQSFDVAQNDLAIINPNEIHYFGTCENRRFLSIIINPSFFADVDFENTLLMPHIRNDETIRRYFEKIFE